MTEDRHSHQGNQWVNWHFNKVYTGGQQATTTGFTAGWLTSWSANWSISLSAGRSVLLRSLFSSSQMAEARGVPRGNYDGPVHDVISMTKSVPPTPTTRGLPCPKTQTGSRNLHQSGFTLAGSVHISMGRILIKNMINYSWLSCILGNTAAEYCFRK